MVNSSEIHEDKERKNKTNKKSCNLGFWIYIVWGMGGGNTIKNKPRYNDE